MTILFLATSEQSGTLSSLSLQTLSATQRIARELKSDFYVGLIGADTKQAACQISNCSAKKFLTVCAKEYADSCYAYDLSAIESLVRESKADIILAPATMRFKKVLPAAAYRLGGTADTQISSLQVVDGELQVERWYYRQRIKGTMTKTVRPWCLLLEAGIDPEWQVTDGQAETEQISVELPACHTRVLAVEEPAADARTIRPEADLLFVAGAGWTKKQANPANDTKKAADLILDFIEKAQASLGSSKSLVDQTGEGQTVLPFLSHLNQVGQTGATPHHAKGLATCCHGEEPHVVGWRFIN